MGWCGGAYGADKVEDNVDFDESHCDGVDGRKSRKGRERLLRGILVHLPYQPLMHVDSNITTKSSLDLLLAVFLRIVNYLS